MKRYVALLRGINVSGKNKLSMLELKECFLAFGYTDVRTHLNSGNVIFSIDSDNEKVLAERIIAMIQDRFDLDIPVFVILQDRLKDLLGKAPDWWGTDDNEVYDNLIFVMPSFTAKIIAEQIGEPTKELESVFICDNAIFWSFERSKYSKANWWKKTARKGIGEKMTIRTANTLRKLIEL